MITKPSVPVRQVSKLVAPETLPAKAPIAFFIPGLDGGGAQRVFVTLVNTLVSITDHPVHLVTARPGGVFEPFLDGRVVRIVLHHKRVSRSVFSLVQYIRTHRPVAMISTLHYCNVVFLTATTLTRVPLRKVIREAIVVREQYASFSDKIRVHLLRLLMRLSYRRADAIIAIAKDVETSLIRHRIASAERIRRVPNPVGFAHISGPAPAADVLSGKRFIIAIGRLSYGKGFDVLIRAFAQLRVRDLRLVILGEGPLGPTLRALANELIVADRVFFPGFVKDTTSYLRSASVFVLSSRWEGFSNALAEALAVGLPIVATDCPGSPREVLDDGRFGRLVPVGDPLALADAIARELDDPSASPEARRQRAQDFQPEKIASEYLRILTEP